MTAGPSSSQPSDTSPPFFLTHPYLISSKIRFFALQLWQSTRCLTSLLINCFSWKVTATIPEFFGEEVPRHENPSEIIGAEE